jgi:methylmalonyl-CoA/ethylmalonyl-CoA epimerase
VALLAYKADEWVGYVDGEDECGKDWVGIHHIGFRVDYFEETEIKIEGAGGKYFQGLPTDKACSTFYEMKYRDSQGVFINCTHLGWDSWGNFYPMKIMFLMGTSKNTSPAQSRVVLSGD